MAHEKNKVEGRPDGKKPVGEKLTEDWIAFIAALLLIFAVLPFLPLRW